MKRLKHTKKESTRLKEREEKGLVASVDCALNCLGVHLHSTPVALQFPFYPKKDKLFVTN